MFKAKDPSFFVIVPKEELLKKTLAWGIGDFEFALTTLPIILPRCANVTIGHTRHKYINQNKRIALNSYKCSKYAN
ncbi:hypothetical protein GCM10027049_17430 [Mucilaginibacter puniceus]